MTQWAMGGNKLRLGALKSGLRATFVSLPKMDDGAGQPISDPQTRQAVFCDLREGILASVAIGTVFPPEKLGTEWYVDGGHLFNPSD